MKEDFYTFGGGQFWEDVFFYQKWRIQRNSVTKNFRLLDNWDIRRMSGTFEECRKAFVNYIDAYEIARQNGHIIIMIHGLGQSKNIFKPLWREALKNDFMAAAVNYPSLQKDVEGHIRQFNFFLDHLEDVSKVSFVTYGTGNIILQKLMQEEADWQKKLSLSRAVEVCPCIYGSKLLEKFSKNKLFSFLLGPMTKDVSPEIVKKIQPLTKIETGLVLSGKPWYERLLEIITCTSMQERSCDEVRQDSLAKEVIDIPTSCHNVFENDRIRVAVINFLKKGAF